MKLIHRMALASFFIAFFPQFGNAQQQCGPVAGMEEHFANEYGERVVFEAVAEDTSIVVFLVNDQTQTWTIVVHDGVLACMVASGSGINVLLPTGAAL